MSQKTASHVIVPGREVWVARGVRQATCEACGRPITEVLRRSIMDRTWSTKYWRHG